jgi:hypothetical protein
VLRTYSTPFLGVCVLPPRGREHPYLGRAQANESRIRDDSRLRQNVFALGGSTKTMNRMAVDQTAEEPTIDQKTINVLS